MEVLEWVAKYWINWVCVLVSGGIALFAKHYVKLQKAAIEQKRKDMEKKWEDKEKTMCGQIVCKLEEEIGKVETASKEEDKKLHKELNEVHRDIERVSDGVLSIQGKQFRNYCEHLLETGHYITIDEYEEFEMEYLTYKNLHGNHRGDILHDRVVDKVKAQTKAETTTK